MARVYSYIRFSSEKQASGNSYRRQVAAAKEFCEAHGFEMAESREYLFFDSGRSAYKGQHLDDTGELARFLSYVEDGSIPAGSYLVVESLDRLSRERVRDALLRFLDLLNRGINVYTSTDKRLYTQDYNELDLIISIVAMSRAHEESKTKGGRVSDAWRKKQEVARAEGKPIGKLCPRWLEYHPDGYRPIPERVALVKRIFEMSIAGYGSQAIAKKLNEEGIPSFSAGRKNASGVWGFSGITQILKNRAVLGEYHPHIFINRKRTPDGEPIAGYFPCIISEDDFYAAGAARAIRRNTQVTNTSKTFNVWAGVLKCRKCGNALHMVKRREYSLRCYGAMRGMCDAKPIRLDRSEEVFREVLAKVDSLSLVQDSSGALSQRLAVIEGRLITLHERLGAAERAYAEVPTNIGARTIQGMEREQSELVAEIDELKQRLSADKVINKDDFFRKLDLVSYEGRAAANNLLKRLGIKVLVTRTGKRAERYEVLQAGGFEITLFIVAHDEEVMQVEAKTAPIADIQAQQGEIDEDEAGQWLYEDREE